MNVRRTTATAAIVIAVVAAAVLSLPQTASLKSQLGAQLGEQVTESTAVYNGAAAVAGETVEAPRPNILLIVSDDQANSTFNRTLMPTVFSQIADKGVLFDRQYVASSLCCPSRAEILTGSYEQHNGVDSNGAMLTRPTIADGLRRAGYRTALVGKYLNSHPCGTKRAEFNLWVCQGNDGSSYSLVDPRLNVNGQWVDRTGVAPEILAHYVSDFVASTPSDQPFFAIYAPTTPHTPADDPRYATMPVAPWRPASYDEDTRAASKPLYTQVPPLDAALTSRLDNEHASMSRAARGLDDSIGTVLDSLGTRADNTLVVYISDNGYSYGEHRRTGKEVPYEESVRTPMAVRMPAITPSGISGTTSHALVQNVDLAPTFAEFARISWHVDGTSLAPLLRGDAVKVRDAALIEHCAGSAFPCGRVRRVLRTDGFFAPPSFFGVVEDRLKYVAYVNGEHELYDLVDDPAELTNLAGKPAWVAEQARLDAELDALKAPPEPDTTILLAAAGIGAASTKTRAASFTYFANLPGATFVCRLDRDGVAGTEAPCPTAGYAAGPLRDGDYTFSVAAVDANGTKDPSPETRVFGIRSAGSPFRIATPNSVVRKRNGTISFGAPADVHGVECQLSRTGVAAWRACSSEAGYPYTNLADGTWVFRVRGTNGANVVTDPPSEAWLRVDNVGPRATFSASPATRVNSQTADFRFTFSEPQVGAVFCSLDTAPATDCGSLAFHADALGEGPHTLVVTAFDQLGNRGATSFPWTVDRTPPTITGVSPTGEMGPDPTIRMTASKTVSWTFRLDGATPFDAFISAQTLYSLADGPHTLLARAFDRAGNISEVISLNWTQRTPPAPTMSAQSSDAPVVTIDHGPPDRTSDDIAVFSFRSSRDATFSCAIDGGGYSRCASGVTYSDLADGKHTFAVRANASGRTGAAATWRWTVSQTS